MRPERSDAALLLDMLEHSERAIRYIRGRTREDYAQDSMLRDAVERVVLIVGEAAYKVSPGFQAAHPEVPWRIIAAQRHILVHDYDAIDDDKIWRVATIHLSELVRLIRPLIPPPPPNPLPEPGSP